VGQKSLTNFTIQLKIINCQEKCETNFIWWIHTFRFFHALSALQCGHPVLHGEHPGKLQIKSLPTFQRSLLPPSSGRWVSRARGNGLRHRNQSAKAETLAGPVGNKVGIGRGPGANRKEGACQTWPGGERTAREWLEKTALFRAPWVLASRSPDISGMWWGGQVKKCLGETGRNNREEIRKWLGLGGALKRAVCWHSGQVGTGNAVSDASYVLWECGWGASMTGSGEGHPPCSWWRQQGPLKRW
jgi:hypothetical protein